LYGELLRRLGAEGAEPDGPGPASGEGAPEAAAEESQAEAKPEEADAEGTPAKPEVAEVSPEAEPKEGVTEKLGSIGQAVEEAAGLGSPDGTIMEESPHPTGWEDSKSGALRPVNEDGRNGRK
jgi:hypothetical protein